MQKTFPVAKLICESSLIIILEIYLSANFALAPCTGVAGLQILLVMATLKSLGFIFFDDQLEDYNDFLMKLNVSTFYF